MSGHPPLQFPGALAIIITFLLHGNPTSATTTTKTDFCYNNYEGCGPERWPGVCKTGERQSPINLPYIHPNDHLPWINLRLFGYRGYTFRLRNNGHSISVDFATGQNSTVEGPSSLPFPFPEPLTHYYSEGMFEHTPLLYKFKSAHFHWGVTDYDVGSEHCISGRCAGMELHFVHFLEKYGTLKDAIHSGDPNALAVLAILIDVPHYPNTPPNPVLAPIVHSLKKVEFSDEDASFVIDEPLDFSRLFFAEVPPLVYNYKGSLTTPPCSEQVNWFVIRKSTYASHSDLMAFRSVKDYHNVTMTENHRPLKPRNGREILLSRVVPWN